MSLLDLKPKMNLKTGLPEEPVSDYTMTQEEHDMRARIIRDFSLGDLVMKMPRREWNDLSTISRMTVDQMSFNTYQPNNGDPVAGDVMNSWRSRAVRPIVRNKIISVAAHTMAHLIFPKIFSYDEQGEDQQDAAQVMEDLMEWAADQSNYSKTALHATIAALVNPASIVYTEWCETTRNVKKMNPDGSWHWDKMLDEDMSGFQDTIVPVDELYIENFYEQDIQKQGYLLWRRVQSYQHLAAKYQEKYPEAWKFVRPGVQLIYNDANQTFYAIYDTNLRQYLCEEIIYWNKNLDVKIVMVNGVMLTPHDNPNPRNDKLYPFAKFGYELVDEGRCFYYKSVAFKIQQDANIVNTLYPMIIDGTYLNVMPPMIAVGSEAIGSDVVIPATVTTFKSKDADIRPLKTSENLAAGMNALLTVEKSVSDSIEEPMFTGGHQTAYELSIKDKEYSTTLGLFVQMLMQFVKQYGRLRLGDILQYLTIADVAKIEPDADIAYKTFLLHGKDSFGKAKTRKVKFDPTMPDSPMSHDEKLRMSFETYQMEGGADAHTELYRVNPELFRDLKYMITISPDVMNPRSEDTERAFLLEEYDRAIMNPLADQEAVFRDFLLGAYRKSRRNPDKYIKKEAEQAPSMNPMQQANLPPQGVPGPTGAPSSPLASLAKMQPAPQAPTARPL